MKYFIAYLLSGEAKKRHEALTEKIADTFGVFRLNGYIPPHVTLMCPFERKNIEDLEEALGRFAENHFESEIVLKSFGHFEKDVIFINIFLSMAAVYAVKELDFVLEKISWLKFGKYEKTRTLHSTVAHKNITEKFDEIRKSLEEEKFEYTEWLDNISILKKEDGKWELYKKYLLK